MMNNECSVRKCVSGRKRARVWLREIFPLCVCVCMCVFVRAVCWTGGHPLCPPETGWIRSDENRAACPHRNWIKEAIGANRTSILNQKWINAKQLTPAPGDVFKACPAIRQTSGEREGLSPILPDILLWAQNKREFPTPHSLRERVWLRVQTEFKTCHSTKVYPLKSQVLLRVGLLSASVSVGGLCSSASA